MQAWRRLHHRYTVSSIRSTPTHTSIRCCLKSCQSYLTDLLQATAHTADMFLKFFGDKVQAVRSGMGHAPASVIRQMTGATLSSLQPCSAEEVRRVVIESPTKSCLLDPIPMFLLRTASTSLLPFLTAVVNASLRNGSLPASPLLKKPFLQWRLSLSSKWRN